MSNHENHETSQFTGVEIAVIGMTARFPGAKNLDEYWNNLAQGIESISFFSPEEMLACGIAPEDLDHPDYVAAKAFLEDAEYFDAVFFGYNPREAEIMAPQTRLSLECAWEALEDAGYDPDAYDDAIGVFMGASYGVYWEALSFASGKSENFGEFSTILLNDKDFVGTYLSYKLNLKGPSFTLFTACSTSGVAIHQACQSLLSGDCNMVLAGGVSVWLPRKKGYIYQEGMIFSKDGHCRPFDANSSGTVFGDGIGMVIMKPLEDAITDRDHIYAVIKGTAINNDGNRKVGFMAPSTGGQAAVIRAAFHVADVEPESISYIETHGTGTSIGDPIEVEALKLAFNTNKTGFCKIGSVKGNFGHLDTSSGFAGFIKTVLALNHRLIPPTLHCEKTNPKIDFETGPFCVNTELTEWDNWQKEDYPLRAGVSFFGVGGTNVHAILEEWSQGKRKITDTREYQLILLSAKTQTALDRMTENLANYLKKNLVNPGDPVNPGLTLANAAYTLQVGRRAFQHRKTMVCSTVEEAVALLSSPDSSVSAYSSPKENLSLIFMFPGQGTQYANMGLDLYRTEPIFREEADRCFEILKPLMGYDIKEILYPYSDCRGGSLCPPKDCIGPLGQGDNCSSNGFYGSNRSDILQINQTEIAQPVIFVLEYALAKLLIQGGIKPRGMIGHSIGEYVAAHLSGVFSLADALKLVVLRGKLMQQMPSGAMLGVQLSEKELIPLLSDDLALAAVNGPLTCVVSGPGDSVRTFKEKLEEKGIKTRPLHTSHAFHSPMMDPILKELQREAGNFPVNKPKIPYISNVTGNWITAEAISDPGYWSHHLRKTVRFADGVKQLLKVKNPVFVEVGPGNTLGTLVRKIQADQGQITSPQPVVNLVRHPRENDPDTRYLLDKLGRLWLLGQKINWEVFYPGQARYRIPLPTYPFERQYFWIEGNPFKMAFQAEDRGTAIKKKPDISDWFYIPLWKPSVPLPPKKRGTTGKSSWMVFEQKSQLASRLLEQLKIEEEELITVTVGTGYKQEDCCSYTLNPGQYDDYESLFNALAIQGKSPTTIVHLWGMGSNRCKPPGIECFNEAQERGFYSLVYLAQVLGKMDTGEHIRIMVVTNDLQNIIGQEDSAPEAATVLAPVITINQEYANISCRNIDIHPPAAGNAAEKRLVRNLMWEFRRHAADLVVAYRNNYRWEPMFQPVKLGKPPGEEPQILRKGGVYLITGGLGNLGFLLAKDLAKRVRAKLVLTGRTTLPPREEWDHWLAAHDGNDPLSRKIQKALELKKLGAELLVFGVDAADQEQMETVIRSAEERFGPINGVIHAAGIVGRKAFCTLNELEKTTSEAQFQAKVHGLLVLARVFQSREPDFCLLMSSLASQLGGLGLTAYTAANLFMDAYVKKQDGSGQCHWITVNWDLWQSSDETEQIQLVNRVLGELSLGPEEGVQAFQRILSWSSYSQLVVSTGNLPARIHQWAKVNPLKSAGSSRRKTSAAGPSRKGIMTSYEAPRNQVERIITDTLKDYFGFDQIGIHDNFFELGATSIDLMQINTRLNTQLGKKIPLEKILTYTTVSSFADYFVVEVMNNKAYNREIDRSEAIKRGKKSLQQKSHKRLQRELTG